jgi:putative oxidoreductase
MLSIFSQLLIHGPKKIASYLQDLGPLFARMTVGYVFMLTGWAKLHNLENVIPYFEELKIPLPSIMATFVSGLECFGGLFLLLGLLTRISAGGLGIVMIVAIISTKASDIDGLEILLGFEETLYLVIFFWLAVFGSGKYGIDAYLEK